MTKSLISATEALDSLKKVEKVRSSIKRQTAKEYGVWFWWGVWVLLSYPPLDFLNSSFWPLIMTATWLLGILIMTYYLKSRRVFANVTTPKFLFFIAPLAVSISIFSGVVLQAHNKFAWTISGIFIAILYWIIAFWLWVKNR